MELQHLMYFKKTAELEHITQASMELRIAQPALSKTIKSIEDEIGVPLFERVNKRIHLNENGKILLDCANEIDALIHDLKEDLAGDSRRSSDVITILLKSAPIAIPSLIQKFNGENPHVNFRLLTWNRMLEEENVSYDFSISSSIQPIAGTNSVPLFEEDMVLAVSENHPFAGRTISLRRLVMRTLFAFRQELSIIMNLFKAAGILDFFRILYWRAAIIIRFLDWWRRRWGLL